MSSSGDGPVEVDLWEDFQCPSCKAFEAQFGETLRDKVDSGDVTMTIHPLSFLDQNLGNIVVCAGRQRLRLRGRRRPGGGPRLPPDGLREPAGGEPGAGGVEHADDLIGWGNEVGLEGDDVGVAA